MKTKQEQSIISNTIYDKRFLLDCVNLKYLEITLKRQMILLETPVDNLSVVIPVNSSIKPNIFHAILIMKINAMKNLGFKVNILITDLSYQEKNKNTVFHKSFGSSDLVSIVSLKKQYNSVKHNVESILQDNKDYHDDETLDQYNRNLISTLILYNDNSILLSQHEANAVEYWLQILINSNYIKKYIPIYTPINYLFIDNMVNLSDNRKILHEKLIDAHSHYLNSILYINDLKYIASVFNDTDSYNKLINIQITMTISLDDMKKIIRNISHKIYKQFQRIDS